MRACARRCAALLAEVRAADRDFADELRAVSERRAQANVGERRRIDLAADGEDLRRREDRRCRSCR